MQANQSTVILSIVVAAVVLLVVGLFSVASVNSNLKLVGEKLDGLDIDENALANAIADKVVLPEFPDMPEYDTEKVDELWQGLFANCISDLEGKANVNKNKLYVELWSEWKDDIMEYVEDNLEDFDDFEVGSFDEINKSEMKSDFDELEFEVTEVGECKASNGITYKEDENSEVTVTFEYDFKYQKDDSEKVYKDTLYITGILEYEDGEFEDLEVTYSL